MFKALRESKLPDDHVFACTIGPSSKQTLAKSHLPEPADVLNYLHILTLLIGAKDEGSDVSKL
jgi:trehalose 6-phosphate synthase/phosphatase